MMTRDAGRTLDYGRPSAMAWHQTWVAGHGPPNAIPNAEPTPVVPMPAVPAPRAPPSTRMEIQISPARKGRQRGEAFSWSEEGRETAWPDMHGSHTSQSCPRHPCQVQQTQHPHPHPPTRILGAGAGGQGHAGVQLALLKQLRGVGSRAECVWQEKMVSKTTALGSCSGHCRLQASKARHTSRPKSAGLARQAAAAVLKRCLPHLAQREDALSHVRILQQAVVVCREGSRCWEGLLWGQAR